MIPIVGETRRAVAVVIAVAAIAAPAASRAQSAVDDGDDAAPGSHRVGFPAAMAGVASVAASTGYGARSGVVASDASHHRATATLAGTWRARPWLAIGLRLDGRYDKHTGIEGGDDDSWVGDPRLFARVRTPIGARAAVGVQAGLWFPSESLLAVDGISPEVRGLASYSISDAWAVAANLGFRVDRSANTVDSPELLSAADRMSLGASEANAVLLGAAATWRSGRVSVVADWSVDLLVGADAPDAGASPMRVGAEARWHLGGTTWLRAGTEVGLSSAPPVDVGEPLAPVEPRVAAWLGLAYRFDRPAPRRVEIATDPPPPDPPPAPKVATVEGVVVDPSGVPVAGATVSIGDRTATTGADGAFRFEELPLGEATVAATAEGFRPRSAPVTVAAPSATVRVLLEPDLPPGQIRGLVRTLAGKPIASATVRVEPLGTEITAGADGGFRVDVPPGEYSVVVGAPGYESQTRRLRVDQDGVTVINVELRRSNR